MLFPMHHGRFSQLFLQEHDMENSEQSIKLIKFIIQIYLNYKNDV